MSQIAFLKVKYVDLYTVRQYMLIVTYFLSVYYQCNRGGLYSYIYSLYLHAGGEDGLGELGRVGAQRRPLDLDSPLRHLDVGDTADLLKSA